MKYTLAFRIIVIIMLLAIIFLIMFCCCYKKDSCYRKSRIEYEHLDSTKKEDTTQMVVWVQPGTTETEVSDFLFRVQSASDRPVTIFRYCENCDKSLFLIDGAEKFLETVEAQGQTAGGGDSKKSPPKGTGNIGGIFFSSNISMGSVDTINNCDSINRPVPGKPGRPAQNAGSSKQNTSDTSRQQNPPAQQLAAGQKAGFSSGYGFCDTVLPRLATNRTKKVVVAVFDTGLDTTDIRFDKYRYTGNGRGNSCQGAEANRGWNFAYNNSNFSDDNIERASNGSKLKIFHGTVVTRQIIEEVYSKNSEYGVEILPVKLLDSTGACFLYDLFCAMKYAQERGANIINASLGYYSFWQDKHTGEITGPAEDLFMQAYVDNVLTSNNILLVCAAGNQFQQEFGTRNLDMISFYPASLSSRLKNVVTVTTVNEDGSSFKPKGSISNVQNYSRNIVDVGVQCENEPDYVFENPLAAQHAINGSSFAAPLVTAALCLQYGDIQSVFASPAWIKDAMMNKMLQSGTFQKSALGLDSGIVDGKYYKK